MSFLGNSMPLPITSDGKQCGSSGSAYIECTKVDGKQFYNITSSHFRAIKGNQRIFSYPTQVRYSLVLLLVLKVGSEEIGSSSCKCSTLLSLTFVEIKKSFT